VLIILVVLLVGIALLAIPIDVTFSIKREETFQASTTLGWLFGLVQIPVRPGRSKVKPTAPEKARRARPSRNRRHAWAMLRSKGSLTLLMRLLRRLFRCLHIHRLRLHIFLGLDDPADTGRLWGMLGPLTQTLPVTRHSELLIQPEFNGAVLRVDGEGTLRIVPVEVMATLIFFVFSPATLRALYAMGTGR
jgi:hypothetical protein